jgi:hypothetical protein
MIINKSFGANLQSENQAEIEHSIVNFNKGHYIINI